MPWTSAGPCLQTEEARAEALELMGSQANLATPKNGEIMICATQVRVNTQEEQGSGSRNEALKASF